MKQFDDWSEKSKRYFYITFLLVIPAIVGLISATIGYLEKGILGALANFIRGVFFNYMVYFPLGTIFFFFLDKDFRWGLINQFAPWIMIILGIGVVIFLVWLLNNY